MRTRFILDLATRARTQQSNHIIDLNNVPRLPGGFSGVADQIYKFYEEQKKEVIEEGKELQNPQSVIDTECDELQEQCDYDLKKFVEADKMVDFYESRKQRIRLLGEQRKVKPIHVERSLNMLREEQDNEVIKFFADY